ncbi:N-acetyltransferase [Carbonactinospora thermoautotrophica]|nr:N-acetyltransferase [Carbonactinospora thermoautotrophica]
MRRVIGTEEGRPVYSDVLGELVSWAGGVLVVRRRDGSLVEVPESTLVVGKVVPAPPPRRREAATRELEAIAARAWPALETEPLGEWWLRASQGFTGRGNSVLPLGDPGLPLDEAVDRVVAWYRARDLRPRFQVVVDSPLDQELAARGWVGEAPVLVLTAPVRAVLGALGASDPAAVRLSTRIPDGWLDVFRGGSAPAEVAAAILGAPPLVRFASVGEPPYAIGRAVVEGRWVGIFGVEVRPELRRRGLARAVLRALLEWGEQAGADTAYLQVEESNEPALALYAALGFLTHHAYRYRLA